MMDDTEVIMRKVGQPFQRRFILFDQSDNQGRIIFHPNIVFGFPNLVPNAGDDGLNYVYAADDASGQLQHVYKEAMTSAFTALQNMRATSPFMVTTLSEIGSPYGKHLVSHNNDVIKGSNNRVSWGGINEDVGMSSMHEDTEDIEALLESDEEECSTGHSPSDVTSNNNNNSSNNDEATAANVDESFCDDEVNSYIMKKQSKGNAAMVVDGNEIDGDDDDDDDQMQGSSCYGGHDDGGDNDDADDYEDGVKKKKKMKKNGHMAMAMKKMKMRMRKQKIKKTVKMLRSILPGGDGMDGAATVLDEAIIYMKSLQMKVFKLEACR